MADPMGALGLAHFSAHYVWEAGLCRTNHATAACVGACCSLCARKGLTANTVSPMGWSAKPFLTPRDGTRRHAPLLEDGTGSATTSRTSAQAEETGAGLIQEHLKLRDEAKAKRTARFKRQWNRA